MEVATKNTTVPKLRFKEFERSWNNIQLGKVGSFKNGINKDKHDFGHGVPFVNLMDVFGKESISELNLSLVNANEKEVSLYDLRKGDVIFIRSSVKKSGIGETSLVLTDLPNTVYSGFLIRYRTEKGVFNEQFKKYCFWTTSFRRLLISFSTTSANTNINQESLNQLTLYSPELPEQQKIASFLTKVDDKIAKLTKKTELLEQYKKGAMQQIFKQELRFKDEDGNEFPEWEKKKLGEVFERVTTKNKENNSNVLTISAQQGLINQEEYFNKSVSAKDVTGYYLLNRNDFAYNKSYSKGYPMGATKRLTKYDKGVVSTLYICFRMNTKNDLCFYDQYFNSGFLNHELSKIAQEGARNHGLLNVSVVEFFKDISLPAPVVDEQIKIASFLTSIDKKIEQVNTQLTQAKTWKKGLLQKMFV